MTRRRERWLAPLIALLAGTASPPCSSAQPDTGASATSGTVRLVSGQVAHYAVHYDRNALADARIAGDSLVALTDAGSLLRFDRATLGLAKESLGPVPATCLGRGEGGAVLAGFADGRIVRIDPASLATTEIARLPGKVQWVGLTTAGAKRRLVAAVEQRKPYRFGGTVYPGPCSIVHDTGSGKTYEIAARDKPNEPRDPSAFLLDRKNRLWLGADRGEWGGWCSYVDLDAGQVVPVAGRQIVHNGREYWYGVYGFAELRDGQVWAFGGTAHMSFATGYVWRVDSGKAEELYRLDNGPLLRRQREEAERAEGIEPRPKAGARPEPPFPTDRPYLPVTNVVEDPRTGAVLVVAFSGVYRTDARLARWEKVHELKIGYQWGRPDAMGAYPSVRSVLPTPGPGPSPSLLFATRFDGLVRLADGKQTDHALPGQFGGGTVGRIVNSSAGLLAFDDSDGGTAWRYRDGAWSPVLFAPPYRPHPEALEEKEIQTEFQTAQWSGTRVLIGRDGSIVTVSKASWVNPGTCTVARWRGGKPEILGSEVGTLDPSACFLTPDGTLWNAQLSTLRRFVNGRWVEVGEDGRVHRADWNELKLNLTAVLDAGPPWILHDPDHRMLFRLNYGPSFKDPRLTIESPSGTGSRRFARDAIPWTRSELLLATEDGLKTFSIDGGRLGASGIETGGRSVSRLARDGLGRLWLGGEGLAVLDADSKTLHALDALPMLGRSKIEALAADPAHPDGIVAVVEGRGVMFVRVEGR